MPQTLNCLLTCTCKTSHDFPVALGYLSSRVTFTVPDALSHEVLLGMDFLMAIGAIIDDKAQEVELSLVNKHAAPVPDAWLCKVPAAADSSYQPTPIHSKVHKQKQ